MARIPPVPLAWNNLAHDRVRFMLFTAGITFAVVLMGVQYGIMNAMLDSNTRLLQRLNAELVLVNPNKASLLFRDAVNRRRLEQAAENPAVAAVHAVYIEYQWGVLRHTAAEADERTQTRRIRVVGVDPESGILHFPEVPAADWEHLKQPGTALYDRNSRPHPDQEHHPGETVYGKLANGIRTELSGKQITLIGNGFELGFDFGCDGTLIVSRQTFAEWVRERYTSGDPLADVDLGAVQLVPGADIEAVQRELRAQFSPEGDVDVLTREQLISREKWFWWTNTPIGFAFGAGVALGFVVGMVICYQILASDVADHMAEYATLKAMGYSNRYLSSIVIQEAVILSFLGFVPGLVVTLVIYVVLTEMTGLPMQFTPGRIGLILGLTFLMCVGSSLLAVGKVKTVDPADVF
jgi:putative ABC transport system permease protein